MDYQLRTDGINLNLTTVEDGRLNLINSICLAGSNCYSIISCFWFDYAMRSFGRNDPTLTKDCNLGVAIKLFNMFLF